MHLADLPLSDLVKGMFRDGATETLWKYNVRHMSKVPRETRKSSIAAQIKKFVTSYPTVSKVDLEIAMSQWRERPEIHFDIESIDPIDLHVVARVSLSSHPKDKPFAVRLPAWLLPEHIRDLVKIENRKYSYLRLIIRDNLGHPFTDLSLTLDKADPDADPEIYHLRIVR